MREPLVVYNLEKMDGASESHRMDGFKSKKKKKNNYKSVSFNEINNWGQGGGTTTQLLYPVRKLRITASIVLSRIIHNKPIDVDFVRVNGLCGLKRSGGCHVF